MIEMTLVETIPRLPPRPENAHKGLFGHALLAGGSRGMTGAIVLAGHGALRAGAGLVTIATPADCQDIVAASLPCAMTLELDLSRSVHDLQEHVLAIGPGLGQRAEIQAKVREWYAKWQGPAVFDADALNALATTDWQTIRTRGPRVLTPHPGEWSRLSGIPASERELQRDRAIEIARQNQLIIVLKGHQTLVTDGSRLFVNSTGNPSMAVGGSGDVLTGVLAGLICQKLTPFDAAVLAVYLHGRAGDIAHRDLGTPSTLPTDLLQRLPDAFRSLT
jgi:NAD(P)H-hydrate epimerase